MYKYIHISCMISALTLAHFTRALNGLNRKTEKAKRMKKKKKKKSSFANTLYIHTYIYIYQWINICILSCAHLIHTYIHSHTHSSFDPLNLNKITILKLHRSLLSLYFVEILQLFIRFALLKFNEKKKNYFRLTGTPAIWRWKKLLYFFSSSFLSLSLFTIRLATVFGAVFDNFNQLFTHTRSLVHISGAYIGNGEWKKCITV